MLTLTPEGRALIDELAQRYRVSADAVETLARGVTAGGGSMAQFNHHELGGGGQWMAGGMTMVGDMFNHGLKATVDGICGALANAMFSGVEIFERPKIVNRPGVSFQFQGGGGQNWWPAELGSPSSTGAQNNMRYAYFPSTRRLAIDTGQTVLVFDTLDHQIGGFGQQQGGGASLTFTSQYGVVPIDSLPRVGAPNVQATPAARQDNASPREDAAPAVEKVAEFAPGFTQNQLSLQSQEDIFAAIERLKGLLDKGILTEAEFQAKKTEFLGRL